jgi:asparagine N-glycosylation enzyme membrane subunit Stt3
VAAALMMRAFLVLSGSRVDRWAGIAVGAMGCIAIWWMPYYPIWFLTYIALVIYALAAYGGNAEAVKNDVGVRSRRPRSDPQKSPRGG